MADVALSAEEAAIAWIASYKAANQMITLDEMDRVIDLLENPPAAGPLRSVLDTYSGPPINFKAMREELSFYECSQNESELNLMLEVIRGRHSLLEVGSRFGGTLRRMASVLAPQSLVVSIDFPMADGTPHAYNPLGSLKANCQKISEMGHRVELILFDSRSPQVIADVRALGPFDFGFIDADHSYEGVKADWENYGPMCKVVGFHDINGNEDGCVRLWRELKCEHRYSEFIDISGPRHLGIGLIHMDD